MAELVLIRGVQDLAPSAPEALLSARAERALIIDDDTDLRPIFRRALRRLDPRIRMDWARGVEEGLALIRRRKPDYVVIDYLLEDGSGLAVKRWLDTLAPQLPYAMISAVPLRSELSEDEGGEIRFLPKPFSMDQLAGFLSELRAACPRRPRGRRGAISVDR